MHKIKAIVGVNRLTLQELSDASGLDLTAIYRILKQNQTIKVQQAMRLALALELEPTLENFLSIDEIREIKYDVVSYQKMRGMK